MSDDDDIKKIILSELKSLNQKVGNTEKCVTDLSKSFALHEQKTEYELKEIKETNQHQNTVLEEHRKTGLELERKNDLMVAALKQEVFGEKGLEPRVKTLEKPGRWLSQTWKVAVKFGAGAGVIYIVGRLLQMLGWINFL